jgi:hypothetical protein
VEKYYDNNESKQEFITDYSSIYILDVKYMLRPLFAIHDYGNKNASFLYVHKNWGDNFSRAEINRKM